MPIYKYKTINQGGEEQEETREFSDKAALYAFVRRSGGNIVSADEVGGGEKKLFRFSFGGVKPQDKIAFARNLAVMLDAGLAVSRALSILEKQTHRKKLHQVLEGIIANINAGQALSESLKHFPEVFPDLFVSMVRAGEESGTLSGSLRSVADQLEKSHTLAKKVKGALIYPSVIVALMIVIGFLMMTFMVPQLTETFVGLNVPLPFATRALIAVSNFLTNNIIIVLAAVMISIAGIVAFARSAQGKNVIDFIILHIPVFSTMVKEVNSARTARTLASLSVSGVDIVVAVRVTRDVLQNGYYKAVMEKVAVGIEKGETMSSIFAAAPELYPVFVSEMTAVGEETGKLSAMLENIATYYENEVSDKTKNLSTIIEPFLMVLIGITVGFFAIAMLAPTYSLVDVIGTQ